MPITETFCRLNGGARHELLHETHRDEVIAHVLAWVQRVLRFTREP